VFKNEPTRSLNGEKDRIDCAGSAKEFGSYEYPGKKGPMSEYGITIAEDGMKISFVFLS
jgi:hypothetical protein